MTGDGSMSDSQRLPLSEARCENITGCVVRGAIAAHEDVGSRCKSREVRLDFSTAFS